MKFICLAVMISFPSVLLAQPQTNDGVPPRGFTIRLAPADGEEDEKSDPLLAPDKKKTKDKGKDAAGSEAETAGDAPTEGEENSDMDEGASDGDAIAQDEQAHAKKQKKKKKRRKRSRKKRDRDDERAETVPITVVHDRPLEGTGASFGRKTAFGHVETIPPRIAARIQATTGGNEVVHERTIGFEPGHYTLEARQKIMLAAISDFLQVSPKIGLVMLEGTADDLDGALKNQELGEARASAVREFMIHQRIDSKRILAYGLSSSRKGENSTASERIVRLRMLSFRRKQYCF